jgi:ABC-type transport system involved in cytochrome c biogenesis permease subunit
MGFAVLPIGFAAMYAYRRKRHPIWILVLAADVLLLGLTIWLYVDPGTRLDDAGLRVLWQLMKAGAAGVLLLVGCVLVFRRRAGVVLLHGGVVLLMLSELTTSLTAQESQMVIPEGSTVSHSQDIRTSELAIIDRSPADVDEVTVVPASLLVSNVGSRERIDHAHLPFSIQVHRWLQNSTLAGPAAAPNPATAGFGRARVAVELPPATGVGEDAERVDMPSGYVELFSKPSGQSMGVYLVSSLLNDQTVEVDGKTYDLSLRFKRIYHPYSLTLKDFKFERYTGTNTPKDYSSLVVLRDPTRGIDREVLIWMNNPLRYAGTTFYQSSFDRTTERTTILQAVTNPTWMTPYVACMLVLVGMTAHFGTMLFGFLTRHLGNSQVAPVSQLQSTGHAPARRNSAKQASKNAIQRERQGDLLVTFGKVLPVLIVGFAAMYLSSKARMPESKPGEMQIYEFGRLPVSYQGRVKPYETIARNTLQYLSGRQELIVEDSKGGKVRLPAIRWLLDAISGTDAAQDHRIFRVENIDLLQTLGLDARPGSFRYSLRELHRKPSQATAAEKESMIAAGRRLPENELSRQIEFAAAVPEKERTLYQHKVIDLATKRNVYFYVVNSFASPPLSTNPDEFAASLRSTQDQILALREAQAPHAVPPADATTDWTILMEAEFDALRSRITNQPVNPATVALGNLLAASADGDAATFNRRLAEYRTVLANYEGVLTANEEKLLSAGVKPAEIYSAARNRFEVFFNHFSPFYYCLALYVMAFVLGVFSWLVWTEPLRRSAFWLLCFTFLVHSLALLGRIYISGRPPVTNLYSASVFVGWGCVVLAIALEVIFRLGIGNVVAAIAGFLSLLVAHFLSLDGDTLIVMQAVLDTQFWLATHVVIITMGYAATYLTGLIGIVYLFGSHVFNVLEDGPRKIVQRMMYATLCFAVLFSFIGTVLGGLWADDSWGRFWGWDPKENGALIIVLYNALALHARWGGLLKGRGMAMLAVGGNIVVTWSFFGVNELGVGLHSYGASESSTAMWLLIFAATQLAIIAIGAMPRHWFEPLAFSRESSPT